MMRFGALFVVCALAGIAPAVVIVDDFSDPQGPFTVNPGNPTAGSRVTGSMLGGSRSTGLFLNSSQYNLDSTVLINGGAFGSNQFGNASTVYLGYFATQLQVLPSSLAWSWSSNTNYDMSATQEFEFELLGNDADLTATVYLVNGLFQSRTYSKTFAAGGARTETVGLADIVSDSMNMQDVDFMLVYFSGPADLDFGIDQITAVPEPGTMAALGLGLAAIARRRRQK